ncbi:hypothetical protein MCOR19_001201, partial [Pyricularia oryzae]
SSTRCLVVGPCVGDKIWRPFSKAHGPRPNALIPNPSRQPSAGQMGKKADGCLCTGMVLHDQERAGCLGSCYRDD